MTNTYIRKIFRKIVINLLQEANVPIVCRIIILQLNSIKMLDYIFHKYQDINVRGELLFED